MGADHRHPLLDGLVETADLSIRAVLGEEELGVAHRAAQLLLDALILGDRVGQTCAREGGELALVLLLKSACRGLGTVEGSGDLGAARCREQVREIPGRKGAERFLGGIGGDSLAVGKARERVGHLRGSC